MEDDPRLPATSRTASRRYRALGGGHRWVRLPRHGHAAGVA